MMYSAQSCSISADNGGAPERQFVALLQETRLT